MAVDGDVDMRGSRRRPVVGSAAEHAAVRNGIYRRVGNIGRIYSDFLDMFASVEFRDGLRIARASVYATIVFSVAAYIVPSYPIATPPGRSVSVLDETPPRTTRTLLFP